MSAITHDWRPAFLAALPDVVNVMDAAKAAGVGHVYAYNERKRDPEFAAQWDAIRRARFYEERACESCGQLFRHRRSSGKPGRFCSESCKFAYQRAEGEAQAVARFWGMVDKNGPPPAHAPVLGPCWLWTAAADGCGYGLYRHGRAHRYSWELAVGPIPADLCVLHRCDTPACVRPEHLFLGTRDDNMRDRQAKRRHAHGERHPRAVLTEDQVRQARALRAAGTQIKVIAARFGITAAAMSAVCTRRSWRHVT